MDNLKKYRQDKKIPAAKMAKMLNVSRVTYWNYESGVTEPDISTLIRISKILDVSIDEIVGNPSSDNLSLTNKELDILEKSAEVIQEIVRKVRK
jgi:transcriptional regulator with XRE-family HTH domain